MKTKRKLIMQCRKRIQVKHTNNPVFLLQMFEVTTTQCNYTDHNGKYSLKNQLITIVFLLQHDSPPVGQGILTLRHTTQGKSPLDEWSETSTWQYTTLIRGRHLRSRAGVEPAIPANEGPQTHDLDRAATGIFFFFFRRYDFILWTFWPSQHIISTYCDPGCS